MAQEIHSAKQLVSALSRLDAEGQSGELLLQCQEAAAKIYLNKGHVTWIFASGQEESFQSILLREFKMSKELLLEQIKESRKSGRKSLTEILLALGIDDEEQRREIEERHVRSAFKALFSWDSYSLQFSPFSGLDEAPTGPALGPLLNLYSTAKDEPKPPAASARPGSRPAAKPSLAVSQGSVEQVPRTPQPESLWEVLERFQLEIPRFLAVVVIEGQTGMPIASLSDSPEIDVEAMGAYALDLVKSAKNLVHSIGAGALGQDQLTEILITREASFLLLIALKGGSHFLCLVLDKDSNPALAKVIAKRNATLINSFLN